MKWRLLLVAILPFLFLSCKKQNQEPDKEPEKEIEVNVDENLGTPALRKFDNVLILGNSITYAPPNSLYGWNGDWGIAASAKENDFVHVLKKALQLRNPDVVVKIHNIGEFEINFTQYDFDAELKDFRNAKPDLVILRIGENLRAGIDLKVFEKRYKDLIDYFKADNPKAVVVGASTVFTGMADNIMAKYPPCVALKTIHDDPANFALGLFENFAIASHPGDVGMKKIASIIWLKVKTIN